MLKRLIALGTVVGAAAYLQNKTRRDKLFASARELFEGARDKLDKNAERAPEADSAVDAEWSETLDQASASDTATSTSRRY